MKKWMALILSVLIVGISAVPALAADQPKVFISSASANLGDKVSVTLSLENVTGLTSIDLELQFNPNVLKLEKVEKSQAMVSDKDISMLYTDPAEESDYANADGHSFVIGLFHLEQFPQSLDSCDVVTLTFEAIGTGSSQLVLGSKSFQMLERETLPLLHGGKVTVSGAQSEAQSWDYAAHIGADVVYTDVDYTYPVPETEKAEKSSTRQEQEPSQAKDDTQAGSTSDEGMSGGEIALIVVACLVAVGIVVSVVLWARGKNIVDDKKKKKQ